jgi:hypothetical protein
VSLDCLRHVFCTSNVASVSGRQSRDTGNIGRTKHMTKTIQRHWQHWTYKTHDEDNPETLATLDTQNTWRRQSRDTGNIGRTKHMTKIIQRRWQHWTHKTHDEDWVTWRVSYKRQELNTLLEHLGSLKFFGSVRLTHLFSFLCCVFCFVSLLPVSCVPNVASVSGLSSSCVLCTQCCQCLWIVFVLCLVCNFRLNHLCVIWSGN